MSRRYNKATLLGEHTCHACLVFNDTTKPSTLHYYMFRCPTNAGNWFEDQQLEAADSGRIYPDYGFVR